MELDVDSLLRNIDPNTPFRPYARECKATDTLTIYFLPEADYSQRLTDHVTVYRALETNRLVGCRIKGVSEIVADLPNYINAELDSQNVLSILFLPYRSPASPPEVREAMNELAREVMQRGVQLERQGAC